MLAPIDLEVTTYNYACPRYGEWSFPHNYHYVYILENGKDVYIGETNDIIQRTRDHHRKKDSCYKYHFLRIHVITGEHMEETPAKHFENLLIKLMRIDKKFRVTNIDDGERTFYLRKNEFELGFDSLWPRLADLNLVNHKEFQSILNKTEFKYSPYTSLTQKQIATLENIVGAIHTSGSQKQRGAERARPILVEGNAGTGKTVIASSLFHYLLTHPEFSGKKIGLVYANTSTRDELKAVFQCVPGKFHKNIISPIDVTKTQYDIIICDEAHRLRRNKNLGMYTAYFKKGNERLGFDQEHDELDWLLANAKCLILLYDKQQIACPSDIPYDVFCKKLEIGTCGTRPVTLLDQMRIHAGTAYVPYIHDILHQCPVSPMQFENYDLRLFSSFGEMVQTLNELEAKIGLCRLSSGYAWKWVAKDAPATPDIRIDGVSVWWNTQTGGWLRNPESKAEMGSIYTLPGLDLNYAAVVIGPDLYFDTTDGKIKVNRKSFFDNKVKRAVSDDELKEFILNTYGVLLTRGILGTFIYVCDDALREYMQQYITPAVLKINNR